LLPDGVLRWPGVVLAFLTAAIARWGTPVVAGRGAAVARGGSGVPDRGDREVRNAGW